VEPKTERVEVLVVGGGPSGLSAARAVAAAGHETLVVERQATVGEHVRTSGVTALETTERLGAPAELRHEVGRLRFCTREDEVVLDLARRRLCVLDVRSFYRWLGRLAEDAGARVTTDTAVSDVRRTDTGHVECRLRRTGGEEVVMLASVVVDASGYRASISRQGGLHGGFERFGVGAEYELEAPRVSQEDAVLVLDERIAPAGYAWAFPWGASRVRLGVGLHHADVRGNPRVQLRALHGDADTFGLDLTGSTVRESHFGLIPAEGHAARVVADGLVAVGDAAGQGTLVVGEGIRTGIRAGEVAGDVIHAALARGSTSRGALLPYETWCENELGRSFRVAEVLNRRLSEFGDREWGSALGVLRRMPADLVLDLLESRFSRRRLLLWLAANPRTAWRSRSLRQAALSR
jgi:digeranylgeranylglycerophospholipid reductase